MASYRTPMAGMTPTRLALGASGAFLLAGLLFGVAKLRAMTRSPEARAPLYVDIGHRASLAYAFAAVVVERLLSTTSLSIAAQWAASGTALALFALTILRYAQLALAGRETSQYEGAPRLLGLGTWLLAAGEVGAVAVLLWGFLGV